LGTEDLAAPHLIGQRGDQVLRNLVLQSELSEKSAATALSGFAALTLTRFPADGLRVRMWELRHNLSAYAATYVALAHDGGEFVADHRRPSRPRPPKSGAPAKSSES